MSSVTKMRWFGFASVAFGTFMATLDSSAVIVALPIIGRDFNVAVTTVEWVLVAYTLTIGTLLLPFGKCGDHWGKHRIFKIGFVLFLLSSFFCGFSSTIEHLILFRIFQGIGGAIYISVGPAILVDSFPVQERGKAIGFMGTIVSLGLMLGASVGGLLTHYLSWRSIFFINIPLGIIGLIWSSIYLPKDLPRNHSFQFDYRGALLIMLTSGSLLLILTRISIWGVGSPYIVGLLLLFVISGFLFVMVEKKNPYGVFDFSLFKNKFFVFSNISLLLYFISIHMTYFLIPFYLTEVLHYTQNKVGFAMMAVPTTFAILNPISGSVSDKIGARVLAPLGLFVSSIAYIAVAHLSMKSTLMVIMGCLSLIGMTGGLFQSPNSSAIMGSVSQARLGMASAMIATMRNFGSVMGVAFATLLFSIRIRAYDGIGAEFSMHTLPPDLFLKAFHDTLWAAAVIVCIAGFFSLQRGR